MALIFSGSLKPGEKIMFTPNTKYTEIFNAHTKRPLFVEIEGSMTTGSLMPMSDGNMRIKATGFWNGVDNDPQLWEDPSALQINGNPKASKQFFQYYLLDAYVGSNFIKTWNVGWLNMADLWDWIANNKSTTEPTINIPNDGMNIRLYSAWK